MTCSRMPHPFARQRLVRAGCLAGFLVAWVAGLVFLGVSSAVASGFLVPTDREHDTQRQWQIEDYKVDIVVRGRDARVRVEQHFKNIGSGLLEADYLFPVPAGAMVSGLSLLLGGSLPGGSELKGRLLKADEARRVYEEVVRRRKDPALLQYIGQDIYRVRVFPIPAGMTARLILSYDQTLRADAGLLELLHPLSSVHFSAAPIRKMRMHIDLGAQASLGPIYSPSHDVVITRKARNHAEITFQGPVHRDAGDFRLFWTTTSRRIGASLFTYWPKDESLGYFLFLAAPSPHGVEAERIRPKSITFVVDVSGSMGGEKLEQVRAALKQIIPTLRHGDQFNVIAYHNRVFSLWQKPHAATLEAKERALLFVDALSALGGTRIEGALLTALSAPAPKNMPSIVLFLTDGVPTIGETDPEKILAMAQRHNGGGRRRLFVLGVGVDVNTVLLERLALENRGVPMFARPQENVGVKVSRLYEKVRNPVLTDVTFDARGMKASSLLPHQYPDLFRGDELLLAGRYARGGSVEVVLSGRAGDLEREFHYTLTAARRGEGVTSDFPARVWATRRIAELIDAVRLHKQRDPKLVREIVRLSTKFGIMTEYTSFLADETGVSHRALEVNVGRTQRSIDVLTVRVVGGTGVAQAMNNALRRGAIRAAPPSAGYYIPTQSDRDLQRVPRGGVQYIGNRTFYYRGRTIGWVDSRVRSEEKPAEVILRWSPAFFELLRKTSPAENARLAQEGTLLLEVQGRVVRIEEPK